MQHSSVFVHPLSKRYCHPTPSSCGTGAVHDGDARLLHRLLFCGADVNTSDVEGRSLLTLAAFREVRGQGAGSLT
jgi:hypothetical protein